MQNAWLTVPVCFGRRIFRIRKHTSILIIFLLRLNHFPASKSLVFFIVEFYVLFQSRKWGSIDNTPRITMLANASSKLLLACLLAQDGLIDWSLVVKRLWLCGSITWPTSSRDQRPIYLHTLANFPFRCGKKTTLKLLARGSTAWLHQHCSYALSDRFSRSWTGRSGPITWTPVSPDLTPHDFSCRAMSKVSCMGVLGRWPTWMELKQRITAAGETATRETPRRVWAEISYRLDMCRARKGQHVDTCWQKLFQLSFMSLLFSLYIYVQRITRPQRGQQ
jgi:hypothetical protein